MAIVIDSITVDPPHIPPGGTARVTVRAHTDGTHDFRLNGPSFNQDTGREVPMAVTVHLPRTVTLSAGTPLRGTLAPVPGQPNEFIYTAEAAHA